MEKVKTKEELFRLISNSSNLGVLGLFIGSGFTKSVIKNDFETYSWLGLIEKCCDKLGIDYEGYKSIKCSCSELASMVCREYATKNRITYQQAIRNFKEVVGKLTNIYAYKGQREKYESWFKIIDPSWIVTTNYDTIIENVLGGRALSITPDNCFCKVKGLVPVFHIHGIYNNPDSIVITDEDYISFFRPNNYRQTRLPFLIKESCVLMIGYRLGDVNVKIAVDWANDVFDKSNPVYSNTIVQLVYKEDGMPKPDPYYGDNGTIMYEFKNLEQFLSELCEFTKLEKKSYKRRTEEVEQNIKEILLLDRNSLEDYLKNYDKKTRPIIMFFAGLEREFGYAYNSLLYFVREAMIKLKELSAPSGGFEYYGVKLKLILDLLIHVPILDVSRSLFATLASELASLNDMVDKDGEKVFGTSYYASQVWADNKNQIPREVIDELNRFSDLLEGRYSGIRCFTDSIPKQNIDTH